MCSSDLCRSRCDRVHWLQTAADLDPTWIRPTDTVGLTAGTSTPDSVIEAVETALNEWAAQCGGSAPEAQRLNEPARAGCPG